MPRVSLSVNARSIERKDTSVVHNRMRSPDPGSLAPSAQAVGVHQWSMDDNPAELRARVEAERKRRGRMSVREAAVAGNISNTTWGKFETGEIAVTRAIRRGVATAFDWNEDWPERPPPMPLTPMDEIRADLDRMSREIADVTEQNRRMRGEIASLVQQNQRLAHLFEGTLAALQDVVLRLGGSDLAG